MAKAMASLYFSSHGRILKYDEAQTAAAIDNRLTQEEKAKLNIAFSG